MTITHIYGTSRFTKEKKTLVLNDFLLVPSTSKNLLSIQFGRDNHVFLEFDCHIVTFRNVDTREVLLEEVKVDGRY